MKVKPRGRVMIQNALRLPCHKSRSDIAGGRDSQFPEQEVSFPK